MIDANVFIFLVIICIAVITLIIALTFHNQASAYMSVAMFLFAGLMIISNSLEFSSGDVTVTSESNETVVNANLTTIHIETVGIAVKVSPGWGYYTMLGIILMFFAIMIFLSIRNDGKTGEVEEE